jgi:hypothetical protein
MNSKKRFSKYVGNDAITSIFKVTPCCFHYKIGINYFADLRLTFRQNFFLQAWFRNEFVVGLG